MTTLGSDFQKVLHHAFKDAEIRGLALITQERLLWAMLDCSAEVQDFLDWFQFRTEEFLPKLKEVIVQQDKGLLKKGNEINEPAQMTLGVQRVIQRALLTAQEDGLLELDSVRVLRSLLVETDSDAVYLLAQRKVTAEVVDQYLCGGDIYENTADIADNDGEEDSEPTDNFVINLNEQAKMGLIDPIIGRADEIERLMQILCRRRKNNPILLGEAGVGKTAIAEGLVWRIVQGTVPEAIQKFTIYQLDLGAMLAGTQYRGDFEKRVKKLLSFMEKQDHAILFIDEIHQILGAGAVEGKASDATTLLKPALAKGTLRTIGATTYEEYRKILSKDTALVRRFQKIDVGEPSIKDTIEILKGLKSRFEAYHNVEYSPEAITAAVELTARYVTDRKLPDKAIDAIDEAGAKIHCHAPYRVEKTLIGKKEIEEVVSKIARIPPQSVSTDDKQRLLTLEATLKSVIFGQNAAIDVVTDAIKLSRSGLGRDNRPIGSFLFSGPTGVGKTELARQLALALGIELIRFDMSEYMERHAVSRLIGAPPGYVGFDQGGLLTEAVNQKPHAVLLLDEIEKAHPDIFNILLQVMDHGKLTDNNGKSADFRNIILIMTTNAGAEMLNKSMIGFTPSSHSGDELAEIKRLFTPEFRNRLDAQVSFKPLGQDEISKVVDKFLLEIERQLARKNISVTFSSKLREYLAKSGFDPQMGARPMARLIQQTIRKALADELLFGELGQKGGTVKIDLDEHQKTKLLIELAQEKKEKVPLYEKNGTDFIEG